jgi:hypothetical protein
MKDEHNKKLAKTDVQVGKVEVKYPYCSVELDDTGHYHVRYSHPDYPEKSFTIKQGHNGGYEASHPDDGAAIGQGLNVLFSPGHTSHYAGGGKSDHTDGHTDSHTGQTSNKNVTGDESSGIGGSFFHGVAQKMIQGVKEGIFHHSSGGSDSKDYHTSKGDVIREHTGNEHTSLEGDLIESVSGNKHLMIGKGENGIHLQSGNMDTQLDKGKYRVKAAKEIVIESTTSIKIVVGKNYIEITPDGIVINAKNGSAGVYSESDSAILSGKSNIIVSDTGTTLEAGSVPPVGKISP